MHTADLLQSIRYALPKLRKSEQKVAQYVIAHPDEVIHMRIVDLASEAQVSEPTIVRFCRAILCDGFQDFKLKLAQTLAASRSFGQFSIGLQDPLTDVKHKIFDTTISILQYIRDTLVEEQLALAIDILANAQRVEFYGYGASGAVAHDALHKFFRLQISTAAYSDPHMQTMSAVMLSSRDAVVAISQSGRTTDLLHSVELVQSKGAKVISLSPSNTPLAELSDIPIAINVEEDTDLYTPMSSRIAHLVVIDILAVGVALRRGPEFDKHLDIIKKSLHSLRLSANN